MKKIATVFGSIVVLLVAAMAVIPMVVDVNDYRPQLEQMVEEQINGKIKIGKLKLSLWGRVLIEINGVEVKDLQTKIVSVDRAWLNISFYSFLVGSPHVRVEFDQPQIWVRKNKDGKINLLNLVEKNSSVLKENTEVREGSNQAPVKKDSESVEIPSIMAKARLSLNLNKAHVFYEDLKDSIQNDIQDLNVEFENLSLSHPTSFRLWAELSTKVGKDISLNGPFEISGTLKPELNNGTFQWVDLLLNADLNALKISIPQTFDKQSGVPLHLMIISRLTPKEMTLEKMNFEFHEFKLKANGKISDVDKDVKKLNLAFSSEKIGLNGWEEILPSMKGVSLSGDADLKGKIFGASDQLKYELLLGVQNVGLTHPMLKAKGKLDLDLKITTDQIEKIKLKVNAPGNDLLVMGYLKSFVTPELVLDLTSSGMDLDQWVKFNENKPQKIVKSKEGKGENVNPAIPVKEEDLDLALAPLRKNDLLKKASAKITVNIPVLVAKKVSVKKIQSKMSFKNLIGAVEKFNFEVFDGIFESSLSLNLKKVRPEYDLSVKVKKFDLKKAVESQLQLFKNTVYGIVDLSTQGKGVSFNKNLAIKNFVLNGSFFAKDAVFASIDVTRMVTEGVNGSIDQVGKKIPGLKGKSLKNPKNTKAEFEYMKSSFSMKNGIFFAPVFYAKAKEKKGVDLSGNTKVNFLTEAIEAKWDIIDRFNLTKAHDLSVTVAGNKVEHVLSQKGKFFQVPVSVGCKLSSPCYQYGEIPGYLVQVATQNMSGAAKARVRNEVKKKSNAVKKQGLDKAKKLFKKFF